MRQPNSANDLVERVKQERSLQGAVDSIMSELPPTWTREDQTRLVWSTLALAYSIGVTRGGEEMSAAINKAIAR
jgi:hypothetical protein